MESVFYIELNMRRASDFEKYGWFELGRDRAFASWLFSNLEGRPVRDDSGILHLDLVEKRAGLPVNLQVLDCTVEELSGNVKRITKELFKRMNLDPREDPSVDRST